MAFQARSAILGEIGAELDAGVLAYVTGDRENLETEVGADVLRRVPRHLETIGKQDRLALVLYTLGGDTNTPWPFVNFLRGYCDELFVLVPFWAHSAGTLIALGADKIFMTRFGTLSPVDPSVTNEFNPPDPASPATGFRSPSRMCWPFSSSRPSRAATTRTWPAMRSGSWPSPCTRSRSAT
jgi:membrane-bound ClpP family serine protease